MVKTIFGEKDIVVVQEIWKSLASSFNFGCSRQLMVVTYKPIAAYVMTNQEKKTFKCMLSKS
jgi:hypothetical protein